MSHSCADMCVGMMYSLYLPLTLSCTNTQTNPLIIPLNAAQRTDCLEPTHNSVRVEAGTSFHPPQALHWIEYRDVTLTRVLPPTHLFIRCRYSVLYITLYNRRSIAKKNTNRRNKRFGRTIKK